MMPLADIAIDNGFAAIVVAVLGGGLVTAFVAYKRTPKEIESISVVTMSKALTSAQSELSRQYGTIEQLRNELDRKDHLLAEQNRLIGELRSRSSQQDQTIERLSQRVESLERTRSDNEHT